MKISNTRHSLAVLVISLLVFSGTCSDQPLEPEPQDSDLTISMQVSASVEAVSVEITADDITTPIVENIPVSHGVASGTIAIPVGLSRLITVHAFDTNAIETHRGSKTVDVVAGENLIVEITLIPLTGEQPIMATVGTYQVTINRAETSIDVLESVQFTATVTGANNMIIMNPTLRWGSMNPIVAEVDQTGLATGEHAGITIIVVNYLGIAAAVELTVAGELLQRIAFQSNRNGNEEIYVVHDDGTGLVNVTNNEALEADAVWSPDGTKLAFSSDREDPGVIAELYVMNADGSAVINISNNDMINSQPSWSPDGTQLVHRAWSQGVSEIHVSNANGSGSVSLPVDGTNAGTPMWSPDGTRIAFSAFFDGSYEIFTMNPDGTDRSMVTNSAVAEYCPTWSPDGTRIAFPAEGDIYVMNADGSGLTNLTNQIGNAYSAVWSPDGSRIVFYMDDDNYATDVYVMNADGSGLANITNDGIGNVNPSWSPDGTTIVFASHRDDNYEIYLINPDGSGLLNLTNDPGRDEYPAWGGLLVFPGPGY